jgi:ribosomal protein L44E
MIIKDGWLYCPICSNKTRVKVKKETKMKFFPLFCPICKNETIVDVEDNKLTRSYR